MKQLCRTNNPIELSWIEDLLDQHNISYEVFDKNLGNLFQGMFDTYARVMVSEEKYNIASEILKAARAEL